MPTDRAPTPLSHTTVSMESSSEDKSSERSDSIATVEIFRSDSEPLEPPNRIPSENTEGENVTRLRTPNGEGKMKFSSGDIPEIPLERKKSNGLSKGVILNAMNFGSYDLNCNPKDLKEQAVVSKEHELRESDPHPKALEASSAENLKAAEGEKSEEKKKMSLPRKIAFGFSFIPSVMFVLAFAVILPCEEYVAGKRCVKNRWSLFLNQTEITSDLSFHQTLLLGYQFRNSTDFSDGLVNLDDETGKELWNVPLKASPKSIECGHLDADQDNVNDCLAILENGNVYAFNLSDGYVFWTFSSSQPKDADVLLLGCPRYKGSRPIAVASYNKENTLGIDVLSEKDGSLLASKQVKLVDKCVTFSMKHWKHDGEIDLVFFCKNANGPGYIWSVKQNLWCLPEGFKESIIVPQLLKRFDENETRAIYLPTAEGVLIWTSTEVTFLESDGTVKWQDPTINILQKRIPMFGNFYRGGEQIALIGQNGSSEVVVTIRTSEDGKELRTLTVPGRTLNQAVVLKGNDTDAILLSVLRIKVTETEQLPDKEIVLLGNVSSSSEDFHTDVSYKVNGKRTILEELQLLQFEGENTTHVLYKNEISVPCENGGICESEYQSSHIISAFSEEKGNSMDLKIVVLKSPVSTPNQNGSQFVSQLTALHITHEDSSLNGETSCTL